MVRFNEAALFTVTQAFVPLNHNACPNFPAVQVAFEMAPLLRKPEESLSAVPLFSFIPSARTRPFAGTGVLPGIGVVVAVGKAVAAFVAVGVGSGVRVLVGKAVAA